MAVIASSLLPTNLHDIVPSPTAGSPSCVKDIESLTDLDTAEHDDNSSACSSGASIAESNAEIFELKKDSQQKVFVDLINHYRNTVLKGIDTTTETRTSLDSTNESQKIIDQAREYQQELFERAKAENVIVVLDTGSGKTLIACLLIRWMIEQERLATLGGKKRRIIFFIATSIHLVQQQAKVLSSNISEKVTVLHSGMASNLSNKTVWQEYFENSAVIACTPAILNQCLMRAFLELSQISLLVFDEAHHAKKDHDYSRLMKSYYLRCDPKRRPKIFGMTASPLDSKGSISETAQMLEELLNAKIVTTDDASLLSCAPKPCDVTWTYSTLRLEFETELCCQLRETAGFCNDLGKAFDFAKRATAQLGPWCADKVWSHVIGASSHESSSIAKRFEQSRAYASIPTLHERERALTELEKAGLLVQQHVLSPPETSFHHLSSKVIVLHDRLKEQYRKNPDTRAIVFVNERLKALVLQDLFLQLSIENLRPGILLGVASGSGLSSVRSQEEMLRNFRAGLVNLVFATSVADEGLDIPQCNLCIRFDLCTTTIQYMQSKGRARKRDSLFVHMVEDANYQQQNEVSYQIEDERYIKRWCSNLPADRKLGKGTKLARLIARDCTNRRFETRSGAVCDLSNSLLILSRFAASLQHSGPMTFEVYEEEIDTENVQFRYRVRLPMNSDSKVIGSRGEWRPNKQLAKRSAAFGCCILLRRQGELDDHLNSIFKRSKPENLNARLAVTNTQSTYPMQVKPAAWNEGRGTRPVKLYATSISLHPIQELSHPVASLVMLTRHPLPKIPQFRVYLEAIPTDVKFTCISDPVNVSYDDLTALTAFTLDGVFEDIFNKKYAHEPENMSYWLAPRARELVHTLEDVRDIVDINAVRFTQRDRINWASTSSGDDWTDKFVCDPLNGKFHYFTSHIVKEANIHDPVPGNIPQNLQKATSSIIEFSDSHWKRSRNTGQKYDEEQPVISADLVGTRRNFLDPTDRSDFIPCLIAPQTLEIGRISPLVAASCLAWPAIIHRIEDYMIALEAFAQLGLADVPPETALEALTKGADDNEVESQHHTEGVSGIGKNYERLEFIGDSLLKMMTTITIFNRTKCDEEGMHCRRMEIICNRRLFNISTSKFELFKYARTAAFNRDTWYPEGLKLLKGRGAQKDPVPVKHRAMNHNLGMKTIADMAEAVIGAAVMSPGDVTKDQNFDKGIQAITKLVQSEDHDITCWSDIRQLYETPAWSLSTDDPIANNHAVKIYDKTGYRFNHPRLLRSAFTHSSDTNSPVQDLQRLEFLGDAVLDWVSVSWLFHTNPTRNPQWLTEHKMAMVSNKFLACLAVVLDFDKFLFVTTAKLLGDISGYASKVREILRDTPAGSPNYRPDFWVEIENPPKALSDLVESYLGAVLVDSDWDYSEVENFFEKHVKPFFIEIEAYNTFANRHPTTYLHKRLGEEFRCRNFRIIEKELTANENSGAVEVIVGFLVHEQVVASAKGSSSKYARIRMSKQVLAELEGATAEAFRTKWGCDCGLKGKES